MVNNLKLANFYRHLFFLVLFSLGFSYLVFLLIFSQKLYSGFVMQFIFLFSALPLSLSHTLAGLFWLVLLFFFFRGIVQSTRRFCATRQFLKSLPISIRTPKYLVFSSPTPQAFTAGFLRPRIYFSSALTKLSSLSELNAILYHETSHQQHFDPIKDFFVGFLFSVLPPFPLKSWIFSQYWATVEINCDTFSRSNMSTSLPLVSALIKIQEFHRLQPAFVSAFSAHSQRVRVLIGQKTHRLGPVFLASITAISLFSLSAGYLSRSHLFYQCQHLLKCFQDTFISKAPSVPFVHYLDHQCHPLSSVSKG